MSLYLQIKKILSLRALLDMCNIMCNIVLNVQEYMII